MKKIIVVIIFIAGCKGHSITPVITGKKYKDYWGKDLPDCICRYWYQSMSNGNSEEFEDSCHLYKIGDKLKDFQK